MECTLLGYSLGKECITCPDIYATDAENITLCNLYEELQILTHGNSGTTQSPLETDLQQNVSCIYSDNPTSEEPLCDLWCQIQAFKDAKCIQCPEEYSGNQQEDLLCILNEELVILKENGTVPNYVEFAPVKCQYENDPTSSYELCILWCDIQEFKGNQCIKCPEIYKNDPESNLLCDLHDQFEIAVYNNNGKPINETNLTPVICKHQDNPTSSEALCDIWCSIQEIAGFNCIQCPAKYINDPEKETLCDLNEELVILQHNKSLSNAMAFDLEPVVCAYQDNPTSSFDMCDLWCQIQVKFIKKVI